MTQTRTFVPAGRRVAWFATLLGAALLADGAWSASMQHLGPALVVGAIGLERLLHAGAYFWNGRHWPWRMVSLHLKPDGLEFLEANAHSHRERVTTLPVGLVLKAEVEPGEERECDAAWVGVLYTILGTIIWSEHDDRSDARRVVAELQSVLDRRTDGPLQPPRSTGAFDIIGSGRAVMWGKPPVIPLVIVARCLLLLAAIFTLPALVTGEALSIATWTLVAFTVVLLTFPFVGAASVLMRRGRVIGFGASIQDDELRAWEQSTPSHSVPLRRVRHIGFGTVRPDGRPLAMRLVAHTDSNTPVESWVATSWFVQMAVEAYRLLAEGYDVDGPMMQRNRWSVRLPGGVAEAIEAVSWMQRFVAEAGEDE